VVDTSSIFSVYIPATYTYRPTDNREDPVEGDGDVSDASDEGGGGGTGKEGGEAAGEDEAGEATARRGVARVEMKVGLAVRGVTTFSYRHKPQ
jgi:hypothetical protein